jgi:GNAT superfamily N-acetyltransferase
MQFSEERLADIRQEIEPILYRHWQEIAWNKDKIPLDVDWDRYDALADNGSFVCYTARIDGKLVGYSAYFLAYHLHYKSTLFANNDVLYIDREYRGGGGAKFIKWCEERLSEKGVQVHGLHIKKCFDWSALAVRLGFEPIDTILLKWVGK